MATVTFDKATRVYPGSTKPAVDGLDIDIADGEFLVLVGPSGCGKSTSLRMLAGLEDVNGGAIRIGDRDVTHLPPKDRDIAMVFQNYALYPHMSVADNMGFALKIAGVNKAEIRQKVEEAAKILDLTEYLDRKPKALSGGQRQRVAMGRAIVREPQVFLMDEPLSNLDAKLRETMRFELKRLQRELNLTAIYVTHDQAEALVMSSRIAVMNEGRVEQIGKPREIYTRPATRFVAEFIGTSNFLEGKVVAVNGTEVEVDTPHGRLVAADPPRRPVVGDPVLLSVRPECVDLSRERRSVPNEWTGTVRTRAFLGDVVDHVVRIGDTEIRNRSNPTLSIPPGTEVHFSVAPDKVTLVPVD